MLNRLTKQDLSWPNEDCPTRFCECSCVPHQDEGYAYVNCSSRRLSRIPSRFPELTIELNLRENFLYNPIELNLPPMSKLRTLNLERNFISQLDFSLPNNVEVLLLAENNITRFFNNPPSNIKTFTLSHNPWQCDCDTLPFRKWMMAESSKILDVNETRCSFEEDRESLRGKVIITLSEIELCPKLIRNYILMGVGGAVILIMTVASILLYFRYRYHLKVWLYSRGWKCFKKRDRRDDGKLFDAYISFTDEDAARVRKHFLPELEEKYPFYKLFVPQRDLKAGNFEMNYLMERVVDSKRTVILLTKVILEAWCTRVPSYLKKICVRACVK
ncbi:protein toll-like [Parasteatoda tepidariorum]|uniref:protein toll-like n=1 Tax=Parasteatoda tepidariorum TaxID=114398 RepID=UPI0039BD1AC4